MDKTCPLYSYAYSNSSCHNSRDKRSEMAMCLYSKKQKAQLGDYRSVINFDLNI